MPHKKSAAPPSAPDLPPIARLLCLGEDCLKLAEALYRNPHPAGQTVPSAGSHLVAMGYYGRITAFGNNEKLPENQRFLRIGASTKVPVFTGKTRLIGN